jgi:hypothetical protein
MRNAFTWVRFKLALSLEISECAVSREHIPSIVFVAVQMEDLLALNAEESRKKTFSQTSSCPSIRAQIQGRVAYTKHDDIVFLIHVCFAN